MNKCDVAIEYAKSFLGVPYRWGGSAPMGGLDCSGFVQCVLAAVGLDPKGDQTAQALHDYFKPRGLIKPQAGALVFFGKGTNAISHVALCIDDAHMIEAGGGGPSTLTLTDAIKQQAYVRIRPITARVDLVACYSPF